MRVSVREKERGREREGERERERGFNVAETLSVLFRPLCYKLFFCLYDALENKLERLF